MQRKNWVFLQWFVSKRSKSKPVVCYSETRQTLINVHERYRSHLKNVGKSHFNATGDGSAREEFVKWMIYNDIDQYILKNLSDLEQEHSTYKTLLYARYKRRKTKK